MLLVLLAVSGTLLAQEQQHAPPAAPQPDRVVRDPVFGVRTRHFGLERRVRMYQWQRAGPRYAPVWSGQAIDSAGFAPGHDNPPFPLHGQRWLAASASIDGTPLDPEVLARLGRWREFRPAFSALPGNLAATFQPQGNGLGSAENPLAPQVGDLRISWRERMLPPLQGKVVLRDGRWRLAPEAAQATALEIAGGLEPVTRQSRVWVFGWQWWAAGGIALLGLLVVLAVRYRRR